MRDARPGLVGDCVRSRFGFPDSLFDSIWSDTAANQAIDNRFSPQRLDRFLYFSRLGQHLYWNVLHHDRFIGYPSTVQIRLVSPAPAGQIQKTLCVNGAIMSWRGLRRLIIYYR